jgi:hypothetical protein
VKTQNENRISSPIFASGPHFSIFDPQFFKLYENPKRGDEIQRGDRTGCWTGEDFTENFLVSSTSLGKFAKIYYQYVVY